MKECKRGHEMSVENTRQKYRNGSKNGTSCIQCACNLAKEYQSKNWLMKRYGITREEWNLIFEKQGRCCAICRSTVPKSKTGWHTDHDHVTKEVRGILCHACNTAMGQLQDNIVILQSMIVYLMRHAVEQRASIEDDV